MTQMYRNPTLWDLTTLVVEDGVISETQRYIYEHFPNQTCLFMPPNGRKYLIPIKWADVTILPKREWRE